MNQYIKISAINYDDEVFVQYCVEVSNGYCQTYEEFYADSNVFQNFSKKLIDFPKSISDKIVFEDGKISKRCNSYFFLKVFCFEVNGHSAIHVKTSNNRDIPNVQNCEFVIKTFPNSLNSLGQKLRTWNPKENPEFLWIAENI